MQQKSHPKKSRFFFLQFSWEPWKSSCHWNHTESLQCDNTTGKTFSLNKQVQQTSATNKGQHLLLPPAIIRQEMSWDKTYLKFTQLFLIHHFQRNITGNGRKHFKKLQEPLGNINGSCQKQNSTRKKKEQEKTWNKMNEVGKRRCVRQSRQIRRDNISSAISTKTTSKATNCLE